MLSGYITELRQDINFVDTFITIIFIVQSGIHANFNFCNTYLFFTLLHHYHTIYFKLNIICEIYRGVTSCFYFRNSNLYFSFLFTPHFCVLCWKHRSFPGFVSGFNTFEIDKLYQFFTKGTLHDHSLSLVLLIINRIIFRAKWATQRLILSNK